MGWTFFEASANGYMGVLYAYIEPAKVLGGGDYLSPTAMAAWMVNNAAFQVILIAAISLIVFGWWGTVFLSSTRMIFASAFDRILPEGVARVTSGGVPYVATSRAGRGGSVTAGPTTVTGTTRSGRLLLKRDCT